MNIDKVLERIEECKQWPNRGMDVKQLTVLRYILEAIDDPEILKYELKEQFTHPDVIDAKTEKAFNAGRLFERDLINRGCHGRTT